MVSTSIDSHAQVQVSATLDSTEMLIGDRFQLHLKATHSTNSTIESIDISGLQAIENIDLETESEWDTTINGNGLILEKDFILQVWDSGFYYLPQISLILIENGNKQEYKTNQIPITVSTVPPRDTTELAAIKPIIKEQRNWSDYLIYVIPLLIIGILGLLIFWLMRRKQQKNMPPPVKIKLPAHVIALTALDNLKKEKLWQKGAIKKYQSRLTHIIREYLENRYEVPALESTTDEILRRLKNVDFDDQWKDKLTNILQVADLVKFAKAEPTADFHEKVGIEAEDFINNTKLIPVEIAPEEEKKN